MCRMTSLWAVTLVVVCAAVGSAHAERPRGIYVARDPDAKAARFGPGPTHRILYMNRHGGMVKSGYDDSSKDTSSIPYGTSYVGGWPLSEQAWGELMTCVRQMYAPFDIEVTDVDPGPAPHIESMVGGTPGQVGMSQGVGGVAPMNTDCSVVERAIVFTFADVYGDDVQSICETVAQESAHALGLDHEHLCQDPMTYLYGCGAKSFQDVDADCGEYSARECMCGGTTQNSVQTLLQILGASDRTPPAVEITEPADGAQVDPGFKVASTASDDKGVSKVDLWIDDVLVLSDGEAPYEYADTAGLPPGPHTISARAYDAAGNVSTATVTVQVKMPGGGGGGGGGDDDDGGGDDGSGGSADDPTGDLHGGCAAAGRGASGSWRALAALLLVTFVSLRRRHPRR